jgi:hypothetical protein
MGEWYWQGSCPAPRSLADLLDRLVDCRLIAASFRSSSLTSAYSPLGPDRAGALTALITTSLLVLSSSRELADRSRDSAPPVFQRLNSSTASRCGRPSALGALAGVLVVRELSSDHVDGRLVDGLAKSFDDL